jgi:hypothetical protein
MSPQLVRKSADVMKTTALIGSRGPISSYLAAIRLFRHATDVIDQGYYQYPGGIFRVPALFGWNYVANGSQHIAEIASAPEHLLRSANEDVRSPQPFIDSVV